MNCYSPSTAQTRRQAPVAEVEAEKKVFAAMYAACFQRDGLDNPALGAPMQTDRIWHYGSSHGDIEESMANRSKRPDAVELGVAGRGKAANTRCLSLQFEETIMSIS